MDELLLMIKLALEGDERADNPEPQEDGTILVGWDGSYYAVKVEEF